MAWLEKDNPQHVHLRTLRSRFLLPLILAAVAVIAIAVSTAWSLADAARRDAESSMAALARVAGVATVAPLPSDAVWYRIDQVGKVVTSSDADAVGKPLADRVLLMEVVAMKEGAVTLQGAEGLRRVYGFARLSGAPGGARYVVVGRPADKVFAALDESLRTWAVLGTILAVIALWLAAVIGDVLLVRKARRLAATMREVVSGDMEARKSLESGLGELDDLTGIFDAITAKIGEAYSATEQKVKKRTVELEFNKGMAELEKARTEALLTSVGDGLFATDNEGRITFINQQGEKMLGFTSKDLVGNMAPVFLRLETDKGEIVPQEKRPTSIALATGARYESPVYPKPYYFTRKDKTRFPAQITVTPIVAGGTVAGTIQVFRDITAEIEFDRRKSEFISIASHQLRSPLSATKWLTDMLRKGDVGPLQPKQQEMADKLYEANERLVTLVNELLNVSRLESGTIKLAPKETDVIKLIDDVMTESTPNLMAKQQTFEKTLTAAPAIVIDQTLIRELTANLISNASKYSPAGSTITVAAVPEGNMLHVFVQDRGMGIPQSDQAQLFRKFFRAGNAAKSVVTGTGLGLYVAKAIVELHGGKIWFDSVEGQGTTFHYTLPFAGAPIKAGEVNLT